MLKHQQMPTAAKSGAQDYIIPDEIKELGDMPLFRAVAWWGFLNQKEFSRNDVSEAFRIDPRRASGIINYICHRNEKHDIVFTARKIAVRGGHCQLMVKILSPTNDIDYANASFRPS